MDEARRYTVDLTPAHEALLAEIAARKGITIEQVILGAILGQWSIRPATVREGVVN